MGWVARVKHSTFSRSDVILQGPRDIPPELEACPLELGHHPLKLQFSSPLFETKADVVVISIQPDATTLVLRHKTSGFVFFPGFNWHRWSPSVKAWIRSDYEPVPPLPPERVRESMERLVQRLYDQGVKLVAVSTVSPWSPGETVHCYEGFDTTVTERACAINLMVYELSRRTGCAVLDIARLVVAHGASNLQLDTAHFLPKGSKLIAEEFARILQQEGLVS